MPFRSDIGEMPVSHDLSLPDWGPYSKDYAGITHLWGDAAGRFTEFAFVCGFYGGGRIVPKTINDENYHHWQAGHNLSFYSYRYELEWKDQVFADLAFFQTGKNARLAKITFHNHHNFPQQFEVILVTTVREPNQWTTLHLQPGESWIPAERWKTLEYWDQFQQDGLKRGVQTGNIFVDGQALGETSFGVIYDQTFPPLGNKNRQVKGACFGLNLNDSVSYGLEVPTMISDACLHFRYALSGKQAVHFQLKLDNREYKFVLPPTAEAKIDFPAIQYFPVEIGKLNAGSRQLQLTVKGFTPTKVAQKGEFILDGMLLTRKDANPQQPPRVQLVRHQTRFDYELNESQTGLRFSPKTAEGAESEAPHYGVWCEFEREPTLELYENLKYLYLQPVRELAATDFYQQVKRLQIRPGFFQQPDSPNRFLMYRLKPIFCQANAKREIYLTIAAHNTQSQALTEAQHLFRARNEIEQTVRNRFEKERYRAAHPDYAFSQERMMTQLLTNVGYSARLQGKPVRHYTPGKAWGGLYFWDAGFHGLGLLEYSPKRALECLNTYLTDSDNPDHPFIMHGTPLPVMIYLYWQIFQKTGQSEVLEFFYPKLKRMYDFLAGKTENSTTDKFHNGLLTSFDYFYNSGGWDDYPPQAYIHAAGIADDFATAVFPSHIIRCAKILQLAAHLLGKTEDIRLFEKDIDYFSQALQRWSWDESAGYFSYVRNSNKEKLCFEESVNFNMGLDGASPLVAGIVTDAQREVLLEKLRSPHHLWTDIGLSAVDQNAPYFTQGEGYWNGRVWLPHQWFFWKALISYGELGFAKKIARTGVDLWAREVGRTYHLWENFLIKTGRGAGCHQFGALSAPVIEFHNAYFRPGQLTTGYDVIIHENEFNLQKSQLKCVLSAPFSSGVTGCVAVMPQPGKYRLQIQDEEHVREIKTDETGAIQFLVFLDAMPRKIFFEAM